MLYHRTKLKELNSEISSIIAVSYVLSCVCTHTHIQRLFPREKKTSSIHRRKEFHEQAQRKVSRHHQVCPRTTRTKSDISIEDCMHHCLLNVSPFPSASSRALHNEGTKNKEFRDTKPNLFSSLLERVGSVILVQHGSPSRAFPPPARATVKSASQIEAILTYIIAFKRARAKRAKCV
jgi:hypothetical protein